MIFIEPNNPNSLLENSNFPALESLISAWQDNGTCQRVEEGSEAKVLYGSAIGFEFLADFKRSYEWESRPRPQSIFYFHSGASRIIELGLEGFFRMSMPHDLINLDLIQTGLFIIRDDIISDTDIFDEYIFFRPSESEFR